MEAHPDFENSNLPHKAELGLCRLTCLSVAQLDEDFNVVKSSENVLKGLSGYEWPEGLTREETLVDLAWHERELSAKRSLAWIIRDTAGRYLGCGYLYPELRNSGCEHVVSWIRDMPDRLARLFDFNAEFKRWRVPLLPPDYRLTWTSNDQN